MDTFPFPTSTATSTATYEPDTDPAFADMLATALSKDGTVPDGALTGTNVKNGQGGWDAGRTTQVTHGQSERFELKNVSHTHEAIMNWMLVNPEQPLRMCAAHFGYSQAWLSSLIHSDLFQARLKEKQDAIMSNIAGDITSKLKVTADLALDRINTQLEISSDPRFNLEAAKLALTHLGFGAKNLAAPGAIGNAQNVQQNFYVASPADLVAARGRIAGGGGPVSTVPSLDPAPAEATPTLDIPALPSTPEKET